MRDLSKLIAAVVLTLLAAGAMAANNASDAAPSQVATPLDPLYLNKMQAKLGFRLVDRLSRQTKRDTNVIVSPASLAAVLALLEIGANDEMRAALLKLLGFERSSDPAAPTSLAALRASMKSVQADAGGPLTLANAIVFDPKAEPYPNVIPKLTDNGAQVTVEDLNDPATIKRINDWVKERTGGLIPSILERAPNDAGLVALNALHFKDRWRNAFDPSLTTPTQFHGLGGAAVEVPMMHLDGKFRFREQDGFIAVELPYATDRFRLVIVTTKDKPGRAQQFRRVADWLAGDGFAERPGELAMPRFSLDSSADLLATLDAFGLKRGRMSSGALGGLSPVPMTIAQVLQRTEIRVDEAGTEAAAATAVTTTRAAPIGFVKMAVDRPFLFALRDATTGLVLVTGYVGNPKAASS